MMRVALLICGACLAVLASPPPVAAMCGGNIFMTCPPSKKVQPLRQTGEQPRRRKRKRIGAR